MTQNLYKVGDWVYCEVSPYQPYVIRRIEELTKTPCGNVEAKVICAFRRRDISSSLLASIERHTKNSRSGDMNDEGVNSDSTNDSTVNGGDHVNGVQLNGDLNELQKYQLKHRELFYSKYTDTIPATTIRAKCSVLLFHSDIEKLNDYMSHDDQYYYTLTYDPYQRTIVADKGEIRVGFKYQVEIPSILSADQHDADAMRKYDELKWSTTHQLTDREIEQFLIIAKSIGTFARALDCNNAYKQPSLPLSAAAASRDITLFHAMTILHEHNYNIGKAALGLVTNVGPIICKDEMEDWSASEANLFEDALDKYGKDFNEIRKDFLPWKSLKSIIEYYYSWKTTDRYVQQKRIKSSEQEAKLKQVYIPAHTKQNQSAILKNSQIQILQQNEIQLKPCESCAIQQAQQWYLYNPSAQVNVLLGLNQSQVAPSMPQANSNTQSRLCNDCWLYWKKFAAFKYQNAKDRLNQLKNQTHKCMVTGCNKEFKAKQLLAKHCTVAHGYQLRAGSPKPLLRNRSSFYLLTTPLTQASRFVCKSLSKNMLRKHARKVSKQIDFSEVNKEWEKEARNIKEILEKNGEKLIKISKTKKLTNRLIKQIYTKKNIFKNPDEDYEALRTNVNGPEYLEYFQQKPSTPVYKPEKLLYEKPSEEFLSKFHMALMQQQQTRKRSHQEHQSYQDQLSDASPSSKRSLLSQATANKPSTKSNMKTIKPPMQSINLLNAPEDIYYHITKKIQLIRQDIELAHLKKLARTPFKYLNKQQYMNQYSQLAKIILQSMSLIKPPNGQNGAKLKTVDDESDLMDTTNDATTANANKNEIVVLD